MWIKLVCGSDLCVDWRWGEVRWSVWIGGVKWSTGEGKLTVDLRLARWSDYREGEDWVVELGVTWSELDRCEWLDRCECSGWALFFLSLSLFFARDSEMVWSENESVKPFSGQRSKLQVKWNDFLKNSIFRSYQTRESGGKWFPKSVYHQNKRTLELQYPLLSKLEVIFGIELQWPDLGYSEWVQIFCSTFLALPYTPSINICYLFT